MSPADLVGRKNVYTCNTCRGRIVTVDLVKGVTPFMLRCRASDACGGTMQSSFYRVPQAGLEADWEWYKPDDAYVRKLDRETAEHVKRGGLLLRKKGDDNGAATGND